MNIRAKSDLILSNIATGENLYGYIQLNQSMKESLALKEGDLLEVYNKKTGHKTSAVLVVGDDDPNAEGGYDEVSLNWLTCRNLAATLGDSLSIRKIFPRAANEVKLMELYGELKRMKNINKFAETLKGRVITRGDLISFDLKGTHFTFMIKGFIPRGDAVLITEDTKFELGF